MTLQELIDDLDDDCLNYELIMCIEEEDVGYCMVEEVTINHVNETVILR